MSKSVAALIQEHLLRLHAILDQLVAPDVLDNEEIELIMVAWDRHMQQIEIHTAQFPEGVKPGDGTREAMERFINRIAEVQPLLVQSKSAIADQLFSQNRRVQSLRRGYGSMVDDASKFHHQA